MSVNRRFCRWKKKSFSQGVAEVRRLRVEVRHLAPQLRGRESVPVRVLEGQRYAVLLAHPEPARQVESAIFHRFELDTFGEALTAQVLGELNYCQQKEAMNR